MAEHSRLSAHELAQLSARARVQQFSAGQFIQHQGDPGDAFWAVIDGYVTIGRHSADGAFTHFAVLAAGDLFGELAFFTGVPRQVDAIAEGGASMIAIDRPLLRQLMAADVGVARQGYRTAGAECVIIATMFLPAILRRLDFSYGA